MLYQPLSPNNNKTHPNPNKIDQKYIQTDILATIQIAKIYTRACLLFMNHTLHIGSLAHTSRVQSPFSSPQQLSYRSKSHRQYARRTAQYAEGKLTLTASASFAPHMGAVSTPPQQDRTLQVQYMCTNVDIVLRASLHCKS